LQNFAKMSNFEIIESDIQNVVGTLGKRINKLENKSILITGASGMLASYIVYSLIYANENIFKHPVKIYLITRKSHKKFGTKKYLEYITLDISKKIPRIKKVNFIIHAASQAAPKIFTKNQVDTINSNVLGLYNLLSLQTKHLESFLFFSSGEVYGNPDSDSLISEDYISRLDHLNDRAVYAEGKRACETICRAYFLDKKLPVKIGRIFHTFGPGLNLSDGRIFSDFLYQGLKRENITIRGNPEIKRPFLYIKDATIMFLLLLLSDKNGEVYNISNNKNMISVKQFARTVRDEFNKRYKKNIKVVVSKDRNNKYFKAAALGFIPDTRKFIREFEYIPDTTLKEAVSRTVSYYLNKN